MFHFNGIDASSFPWLLVNRIGSSILPPVERRYIHIPGREGAYYAGRNVGMRVEKIKITVLADSQEELAEKKRILADWLDTEGTAEFYYSFEPNKRYRAVLSGETNLEKIATDGEMELIFEIPDPHATSTEVKMALLQGATAGASYDDFSGVGTMTNLTADKNGMRLALEGQDYINMVDTSWETGAHNGTTEVGDQYLQIAQSGTNYSRVWASAEDWEAPENTLDNVMSVSGLLMLNNLPGFDFTDDMSLYTLEWQVQTATGGTVTQDEGWVRIQGANVSGNFGIDTQQNNEIITQFPCTIFVLYRGRSGSNNRFIVEDGSTIGYTYTFNDTENQWNAYWFRFTGTQGFVYKNGTLVGTLSPRASTSANQIQIDILTGNSGDFDIGAVYAAWGTDLGPPPSSGWWTGSWTTPFIPISSVGNVLANRIGWGYWADVFNWEEFELSPAAFIGMEIQYRLRVNGVVGAWKTIFNDPGDEGPGEAPIADLPKGINLAGSEIQLRVLFSTRDPMSMPWLEVLELDLTSGYNTTGYWDSVAITGIQQVGKAASSRVTWEANALPAGTSVKVYGRFRPSSGDPWGAWEEINQGDPFPGVTQATDLTAAEIQYRVELNTTDVAITPSVDWLRIEFFTGYKPSGQWISPPIPLEAAGIVRDSSISWTWSGEQTIQVEARLNGGAWQPVMNGGEIPGVRGTQGAVLELRVTFSTNDTAETPILYTLEAAAREEAETEINYGGTAPGLPRFLINITGEINEIQILHVESGQFILLQGEFQPGDELEVDNGAETVLLNGVHRMNLWNIKGRFFKLQKGLNSFEVSPGYGAIVNMEWRERWK